MYTNSHAHKHQHSSEVYTKEQLNHIVDCRGEKGLLGKLSIAVVAAAICATQCVRVGSLALRSTQDGEQSAFCRDKVHLFIRGHTECQTSAL